LKLAVETVTEMMAVELVPLVLVVLVVLQSHLMSMLVGK
jgi:hypothetical protein